MLQRIALPAAFAVRRSTSARSSSRVRVSLKRMLKRARASAGMRLTVLLPISIEVNSRFDGPKCARAVVERLGVDRADQRHEPAHRIVGQFRIRDVALRAGDDQRAVLRAAPADLDHVAERLRVGRLAQNAVIEFFAARGRPLQQLDGAVDRDAFLVAGDQERDRAFRLAVVGSRGSRALRRSCRRSSLSCRPRRGRRARPCRSRWRTADGSSATRRPAAPRRYGRRTSDAARRCRCARKDFPPDRCRLPRR